MKTTYTFTIGGFVCPFDLTTVDTYHMVMEAEHQISTADLAEYIEDLRLAQGEPGNDFSPMSQEEITLDIARAFKARVTSRGTHPPILNGGKPSVCVNSRSYKLGRSTMTDVETVVTCDERDTHA